MSTNRFSSILTRLDLAGIYILQARSVRNVLSAAKENGFTHFRVDLQGVCGKDAFLETIGRALSFPDWFGHNWDAFEDCMTDLSWRRAEGYVLILDHCNELAAASAETLETALRILADVTECWRQEGVSFWTLVDAKAHLNLPELP